MGEAVHALGARETWKISVPSTQLCYESKTALKNKVYFFKVSLTQPSVN